MESSRRLVGNLALLSTTLLLTLGAGELVLRTVVDLPLRRVAPEVRYDPHPVRRFTLRPDQTSFTYGAATRINASGFRSTGATFDDPDLPVILAVGDSFTFGLGVTDDATWPARLQQRLTGTLASPVVVVNAGTISYGVSQQLDLLGERALAVKPDIVIHALYWNDYMDAEPPSASEPSPLTHDGYFVWDRPSSGGAFELLADLSNRSALLYVLKRLAQSASTDGGGTSAYGREHARFIVNGLDDDDWDPLRSFYVDLRKLSEENDFAVFVVIVPVFDLIGSDDVGAHPYVVGAKRMLRDAGMPFLDGFALWKERQAGSETFLPQGPDAHLSAAGYALLAEAIADALLLTPSTAAKLGEARPTEAR